MTAPNPLDLNAIAGAHLGATSPDEMDNRISFVVDTTKPLKDAANDLLNSVDWSLNSMSDPNTSPKYATDPSISYYGDGSLSLKSSDGRLMFSAKSNERDNGAFSLDQAESSFFSNLVNTTLGSLKINTVDGQELNPLSPTYPSTNFSPTKPWIKTLIPTVGDRNLMIIGILTVIQQALKRLKDRGQSENSDRKDSIDIGTIIIDNQEIEDMIFSKL